jgi:tetratricopeptide (TPR) repeat protein
MSFVDPSPDIDAYWEYSDPAASEARFRSAFSEAEGDERLELLTQIARTYSLRSAFETAHQILDEVETQLKNAGSSPHIRYLLERGRTYNSSGDKSRAQDLFLEAWNLANSAHQEGLAVDATHMLAITFAGQPDAILWNQRGLEIAGRSQYAKAQALIPAMLNNTAWELHDQGRFTEALYYFEEAEKTWKARGKTEQIQIARWSVARCLRSLQSYEQALFIQHALESEHTSAGTADGFVFEEIAENLAALGQIQESQPYFKKAYDELSQDPWLRDHETSRLASLLNRAA